MRSTNRVFRWLPISKSNSCYVRGPIEMTEMFDHVVDPGIDLFDIGDIRAVCQYFTRSSRALILSITFGLFWKDLHICLDSSRPAASTSLRVRPLGPSSASLTAVARPMPEAAQLTAKIFPGIPCALIVELEKAMIP